MRAIADLGGPSWFKLGDGDLAMHVERTRRLRAGDSLMDVCAFVCSRYGIEARVIPMSDDPVRTIVETDEGTLGFQEYFVGEQCRPSVRAIRFEGAERARPAGAALQALNDPDLAGIIICPSNPFLSVDPILAVPEFADAIRASTAPVIAVSPIVGGKAIKGPAAKIMGELGIAPDALSIARHYAGLIDGFVLDRADSDLAPRIDIQTRVVNTMMRSLDDKIGLARDCLSFCCDLGLRHERRVRS